MEHHTQYPAVFAAVFFLFSTLPASVQETDTARVLNLLSGFMKNDLTLQKDAIAVSQAQLTAKTTSINNGYNLKLNSGTMTYRTNDSKNTVSIYPSAELDIPQVSGLVIKSSSEGDSDSSSVTWTDTSFSATVNIISGDSLTRKVTLLKAQRNILEAQRTLQNRALETESLFYNDLVTLYTDAVTVLTNKKDLYDKKIALLKLQAQGYGEESSTYRTQKLEVMSYQHKVDESQRVLEKDTIVFAKYCDAVYPSPEYKTAQDFLPLAVPQAEAVNVLSFKDDLYTDTESALWDKYINELDRKSNVNFKLSGTAGYTIDNSDTNSDSADLGTTAAWKGVSVTAGASLPAGDATEAGDKSTAYTLSVSIKPSDFALASVTDKQKTLSAKQDQIAVETARKDYDASVLDQQTSLVNIKWSLQSDTDEYLVYKKLEEDMSKWFKAGVVAESEYLEAQVNRDKYLFQSLADKTNLIIYNNTTRLLFCRDEELRQLTEPQGEYAHE